MSELNEVYQEIISEQQETPDVAETMVEIEKETKEPEAKEPEQPEVKEPEEPSAEDLLYEKLLNDEPIEIEPPADNTDVTTKFAEMAKQAAEQQKLIEDLKAQIESSKTPVEEKIDKIDIFSLKSDPKGTLEKFGLMDHVAESLLDDNGKISAEKQILLERERFNNELKHEREERDRKFNELQDMLKKKEEEVIKEKQATALATFKQNLNSYIDEHSDDCELIRSMDGGRESVFTLIQRNYDYTEKKNGKGEIMDKKTACDVIEKQLQKKLSSQLSKLKETKKLKDYFGSSIQPSDTLSNDDSNGIDERSETMPEHSDDFKEQSKKEMLNYFKFE